MEAFMVRGIDESGDIFKGYNDDVIGVFKDERLAESYCDEHSGTYVERIVEDFHHEYKFMDEQFLAILADRSRIRAAAREMLAYGG